MNELNILMISILLFGFILLIMSILNVSKLEDEYIDKIIKE